MTPTRCLRAATTPSAHHAHPKPLASPAGGFVSRTSRIGVPGDEVNEKRRPLDLTGERFGRLLVLHRAGTWCSPSGKSSTWECRCDCGGTTTVLRGSLVRGSTRSCGCLHKETARSLRKEGRHPNPELAAKKSAHAAHLAAAKSRGLTSLTFEQWNFFQQECHYCGASPRQHSPYISSKGRLWRRVDPEWARAVTAKVQGIDRVDNSKGYSPENCVPCCATCNRIKLDHLTYDEMLLLAPSLRAIREAREARGDLASPEEESELRVSGLT